MTLKDFLEMDDDFMKDYVFEDDILVEYLGNDSKVVVPEGVREIGVNAFWNRENLRQVLLPESLQKIHAGAFSGTSLEQVMLPKQLEVIGRRAFEGCNMLEYVRIPENVAQMHFLSFDMCNQLKCIEIAEGNERFFNQDGVVYARYPMRPNSSVLHRCPTGLEGEVVLNGKTDVISEGAFLNCSKVTGVQLPEGLKAVDGQAFLGCDSLVSIALPDSVEEICDAAFARCWCLESVRLPDNLQYFGEHVFDGCYSLKEIAVSDEALVRYVDDFGLLEAVYLTPAFYEVQERYIHLTHEKVDSVIEKAQAQARANHAANEQPHFLKENEIQQG